MAPPPSAVRAYRVNQTHLHAQAWLIIDIVIRPFVNGASAWVVSVQFSDVHWIWLMFAIT